MKNILLFTLSGPSGVGKTTLCKKILEESNILINSISTTTRAARAHELHGKDYFFITQAEFEHKIKQGAFIEWSKVYNNFYGTSKVFIENCVAKKQPVLMSLDIQGAQTVKKIFNNICACIFIQPPNLETLKMRLMMRNDSGNLTQRLQSAHLELKMAKYFDFQIINNDLNQATQELKNIIFSLL